MTDLYEQQGAHHHGNASTKDGWELRACHRIHYQGEPSGLREPELSDTMRELMGFYDLSWEDVTA